MENFTMRELSLEDLELVSGGTNAQNCRNAVLQGSALGGLVGAAIGAAVRAPQLVAVVGALIGGAVAGKNSPACKAGNNYCNDGTNYGKDGGNY
ncbi:Blp family class II bacteriocin [Acinetobacter sp. 1125_18A]|uniref:Blp family class II bacteriocin n=1 Tax=Acinetobacter sp. 1125_18A TaxID=2605959 RepID=UPI004057D914